MNAYNGTEPYAFLSYAHADQEIVEKIIIGLKQNMCRVWYDEGLIPGESWNDDLADRLKKAEALIVLLTKNSVVSRYVKTEINYALSKNIKVLPVFLEQVDMPAGLEMMLSDIQHLILFDMNINLQILRIVENLPNRVFSTKQEPFLENDVYAFFLKKNIWENGMLLAEKDADSFYITCKDKTMEQVTYLFEFTGTKAYNMDFTITQCKTIQDDYFVGNIRGLHILHVLAKCELDYPLTGPDFQLLLIMVLRIPEAGMPSVCLVDYQYIHITQAKSCESKKIEESAWGRAIDEECKRKLYMINSKIE